MTEHELDTLLRDYGGAVRSVCRAILPGHPQDAEEAEADTFYKLWRGAHLPADETHRRRLVVRTARQCAIDRYRALLRRGETLPLDDRDDAELAVALESELETRELMAQIMALPPQLPAASRAKHAALGGAPVLFGAVQRFPPPSGRPPAAGCRSSSVPVRS